jgi:DNA-binding NarL/FixJ family response regulator
MRLNGKISTCIVEEHLLVRRGIASIVKDFVRVGSVFEAGDEKELIRVLKGTRVDVVILDYYFRFGEFARTAEYILKNFPQTKILVLGMLDIDAGFMRWVETGVHGCLIENFDEAEIERAIYAVVDKDFYQSEQLSKRLKDYVVKARTELSGHVNVYLSGRETEVLKLICEEYCAKEIAEMLSISEKTVHTHRLNIMKKTGAKSSIGLLKYALTHRICSPNLEPLLNHAEYP